MSTPPFETMILGTRGIPARHGGFETFAERLALFLRGRGHAVTVFCHAEGWGRLREEDWNGIRLIHVPSIAGGPLGTIIFDLRSTICAAGRRAVALTLGYNTAIFTAVYRLSKTPNVINMDGIEWQRAKWSLPAKLWLRLNEWAGCLLADELIADHPEISKHLARCTSKSIRTIPYGADDVSNAPSSPLAEFGLKPRDYCLVIARPEPENSIFEIVQGFSQRERGIKLVVLGEYQPTTKSYHRTVMNAASREVQFIGPVYDPAVVSALRCHSLLYIHGHTVGGTNPSLVEAMGAGCAVLAHDNRFNRWVASDGAAYFAPDDVDRALTDLLASPDRLDRMRAASLERFHAAFEWDQVLLQYEALLAETLARPGHGANKDASRTSDPSTAPANSSKDARHSSF